MHATAAIHHRTAQRTISNGEFRSCVAEQGSVVTKSRPRIRPCVTEMEFTADRLIAGMMPRTLDLLVKLVCFDVYSRTTSKIGSPVNKILQDLPSKPKAQMASGQGSHWLIESPTMFIYV
ncbi:hypothetical protein LSAT2_000157 [Lamellibrachia satsuma]|nr:hypothetical protein LSAT2_000157 [Lamellibrachia satsuma]